MVQSFSLKNAYIHTCPIPVRQFFVSWQLYSRDCGLNYSEEEERFLSANFFLQMFVLLEMTIFQHGDVRSAFSSCQAKVQDSHL